MKYCKQCGHDVDDNAEVCPYCGEKLPQDPPPFTPAGAPDIKFCPECGEQIVTGARYCVRCGKPLASFQNPYAYAYERKPNEKGGKVPGILSIVFAFFFPLVGFILGIVAIVKGAKAKYTPAVVMGIIGLVISILMWLYSYLILLPALYEVLDEFYYEIYPPYQADNIAAFTGIFA